MSFVLQPAQSESRKPGSHFETATSTASLFSVDEAELFNFSDEVSLVFYHHFIDHLAILQSLVHPHINMYVLHNLCLCMCLILADANNVHLTGFSIK